MYSIYVPRIAIGGNWRMRNPFFIFRGAPVPGKLEGSQSVLDFPEPRVRVRNDIAHSRVRQRKQLNSARTKSLFAQILIDTML